MPEISEVLPDQLPCPACASPDGMTFLQEIKSTSTGGKGAVMYTCAACGTGKTVYTRDLSDCYDADYYSYDPNSYSKTKTRIKSLLYKYARFVPASLARRWLTITPPARPGRVLDVGCGCGNSLDIWRAVGWKTYGTEITEMPVEVCKANGHDVRLSYEPWTAFAGQTFEWITLDNVLEHIETPETFLVNLKGIMGNDCVVTICVPNYGGTLSHIFGPYWDALLPEQHVTHFTRKGLEALLARAGFEVRETSFQPRFHLSFGHVKNYGAPDEAEKVIVAALKWKKSAILRTLTNPRIAEADGFFMTIDAIPAP